MPMPPDAGWQEEHLACADLEVDRRSTLGLHDAQHHRALDLVEELRSGVVVVVGPLVAAADDHHDHVGVEPDLLVGHRRLQLVAMFVDPGRQVEREAHGSVPVPEAGGGLHLYEEVGMG